MSRTVRVLKGRWGQPAEVCRRKSKEITNVHHVGFTNAGGISYHILNAGKRVGVNPIESPTLCGNCVAMSFEVHYPERGRDEGERMSRAGIYLPAEYPFHPTDNTIFTVVCGMNVSRCAARIRTVQSVRTCTFVKSHKARDSALVSGEKNNLGMVWNKTVSCHMDESGFSM